MKKYILVFSVVFSVIVLGFGFPAVVSAGDPVPGLDITIEQNPGGIIKNTQTDANGNYVFDKLAPGAYLLRIGSLSPQKGTDYNSSVSNSSGSLSLPNGGTEQTVNIELSDKVLPGKDPGTAITVETPGPGRISGSVTKSAESDGITLEDLEVSDPGTLPTSNFYFFKEFVRGLQRAVTFNAVSRAELELKIVNEKAAELKQVSQSETESDADVRGLEKAVTNYKENAERLKARLEALKETSENPNVDKLLDKLADKTIKHLQLFEELKAKHEAVRERIEEAQENLEEASADAAERLDTAKKLKERFERAVLNQRERNVKEIRAVNALDKLELKIKNDEVRVKLSEVKDGLIKKFDARVKSRLVAPSDVPKLIENLPITEAQKLRILEQVKERTGSADIKIRLENIEGKVRAEVKEEKSGRKEEAERMMKAASELLRDLKERIDSGNYKVIPESVKSLLLRAENHIINAKAAFEKENYGEAFGQANSAASAAKNAISQLLRANVAASVRPAPSAPRQESSVRPEVKTRIETRTETKTETKPVPATPILSPTNLLPKTIIPELKVEIPTITAVPVARKWSVEIKDGRFIPSELKVKKGDTVVWTNRDSRTAWPASAIHPTHQAYPGFDALRGLGSGESYSFTFDKVGSWRYHDHLNPSATGVVEVSE